MKIKIIFFGNNLICLKALKKDVLAVVTRTEKNYYADEVKKYCKKNKIKLFTPKKPKDILKEVKSLNPELIVVAGYNRIIPEEIYGFPKFKSINIHPSYLPYYRGQSVINWALINGETKTGVTIHYLNNKLDEGDIIIQKRIPIFFKDNIVSLSKRISKTGSRLLTKTIKELKEGKKLKAKKQEHIKTKYYGARKPKDGEIDINRPMKEIYNLIRALEFPYPNAFVRIGNKKVYIKSGREYYDFPEVLKQK